VKPYDRASRSAFWPEYLRGQALLRLGDGQSAAAEFARILEHRGDDPSSLVSPLAQLGLARAQARAGDAPNARQSYQKFLSDWSGADAGVAPLVEAQQELARLR
jgi:TolA-binding protein